MIPNGSGLATDLQRVGGHLAIGGQYRKEKGVTMHEEFGLNITGLNGSDLEAVQFQSDILAPHEFWQTYRSKRSRQPELELMTAVLEDAVLCYFKNVERKTRRQRKFFDETQEWFFSNDDDGLFTFQSVCSHLGIDSDYIRRGLVLFKRAHQPETKWDKTIDGKKRLAA
jgi:hypothetical protein